jgi:hypothetical protein
MTALRSNDLLAHFAPGAMAAAARWTVGGDTDARLSRSGGSDTPPGGAGPSGTGNADGHDWSGYGNERSN